MQRVSLHQKGFTLIEIIAGLIALSLSFVVLSVIIFPQAQRSVEPVFQARASALGQALLEEIMSKAFDQNSDFSGGTLRCAEVNAPPCTEPANFGPDNESRANFNDVDDYHLLEVSNSQLEDALGTDLASRYRNFSYSIAICYSDRQGTCRDLNLYPSTNLNLYRYKRVQVTVTTPTAQEFTFSAVRGNY